MGGRSAAKTSTLALQNALRMQALPRAKVGWVCHSLTHLKEKVVPVAFDMLQKLGFVEHKPGQPGNYVLFRKPPPHFTSAWQPPYTYENAITFANGYTIQLLSWYNADSQRGLRLDAMDIDEAGWLNKSVYDAVLMPTVSGNYLRYRQNPYHGQICFYTSKPRRPVGFWINDYRQLAEQYPRDYSFTVATSWDNVQVLGRATLERWKKEMHPLEYQLEVMCEDVDKLPNGYYDEYTEERNTTHKKAGFIDPAAPLLVSFDFNAGFVCCVVGQLDGQALHIVDELFVKGARIVNHLLDSFLEHYREHQHKVVHIYGDRGGHNRRADSNTTIFQDICSYLEEAGWQTRLDAMASYPSHMRRHEIINQCMRGERAPEILINTAKCIYLNICLQQTLVTLDYAKDKSSEKDPSMPPEQSTHLTDAFDYLVYPLALSAGQNYDMEITFI